MTIYNWDDIDLILDHYTSSVINLPKLHLTELQDVDGMNLYIEILRPLSSWKEVLDRAEKNGVDLSKLRDNRRVA